MGGRTHARPSLRASRRERERGYHRSKWRRTSTLAEGSLRLQPGKRKRSIGVAEQAAGLAGLGVRPPQRADARRNFDALIAAAREVFAEQGTDASLEDIARRAGV